MIHKCNNKLVDFLILAFNQFKYNCLEVI